MKVFAERRKVLSLHMHAKSIQSCPASCNPVDGSPPKHLYQLGVLQARSLEWVALPSSWKSSQSRELTHISHVSYTGTWIHYCLGSPFRELFNH